MRKLFTLFVGIFFSAVLFSQTITPANSSICSGATVLLTAAPTPSTSYHWESSIDGISGWASIVSNVSTFSASTAGFYRVVVTGPPADTFPKVQVVMNPNPTASFTASPNNQCWSVPVNFTNNSTGGATYLWDFGNTASNSNNTSTAANPSHIFITTSGIGLQTFAVKLVVTNSFGCKDSVTVNVSVIKKPSGLITSDATIKTFNGQTYFAKCQNSASLFTFYNNTSTNNTHYQLIWGDNSTDFNATTYANTTHTYNVGTYILTSIAIGPSASFCTDTVKYNIFVGGNPAGGIVSPGNTDVCSNSPLTFTISGTENNPPGTIYTVHFNDSSADTVFYHPNPPTITHIFNSSSCGTTSTSGSVSFPNSYGAYITIANPCGVTSGSVVPIYVSERPIPQFTISPRDTFCVNNTAIFTNTSTGGNTVESGQTSGNCTSPKIIWTITPSTGWNVISGSLGIDNGTTNPNPWVTGTSPLNVNFTVPGTYTIKLQVGSNNLCGSAFIIKTICVNPTPIAAFDVNVLSGCAPLNVNTTNNSNSPLCGVNTYVWAVSYAATPGCSPTTAGVNYINGTSASSLAPQFQFTNPGIYTISLKTLSSNGICISSTVTKTITVKGKPVVNLSNIPVSICQNNNISPTVLTTCYINSSSTYSWSFPGGIPSTSTIQNPTNIVYNNPGNYTISLTVTNECGATTATTAFTVNPIPIANAGPDKTICSGTTVQIGSNPVTGVSYLWGPTTTGLNATNIANPTVTLSNGGTTAFTNTYIVTATNTGNFCTTKDTVLVTVLPVPSATQPTNQIICNAAATSAVNFTGSGVAGTIYNWTNNNSSIGLALSGTGNIASFTAINTGNTPVIATITVTPSISNSPGICAGTPKTFTITINPTPTVNQPADQNVCNSASTSLIAFSGSVTTGTIYNWSNDNTSINLAANGSGNINSFTATNTTNNAVTATITVTPFYGTCAGTPKTFTITVNPAPTVTLSSVTQTICSGQSSNPVTISSPSTGVTINWTSNSPSGISGATPNGMNSIPAQTLLNSTNGPLTVIYSITATTGGSSTCAGNTFTHSIVVNPIPVVTQPTSVTFCNGILTTQILFSSSVGASTYNWTNDNPSIGLSANGNGNIPAFTTTNSTLAPIIATITVTPTYSNAGQSCPGISKTFTITINPVATVTQPTNEVVCSGSSTSIITFSGNIANNVVYNWTNNTTSIGLASSGSGNISSFTAINNGNTAVIATITVTPVYTTNSISCNGLPKTFTITVNPIPSVTQPTNVFICNGTSSAVIAFSGSTVSGTTYSWINNNIAIGLGASGNGNIPSFTATNATNLPISATITVTPNYSNAGTNCSGSPKTFTITINPTPSVNSNTNQTLCNGALTTAVIFSGSQVTGTIYSWVNNNSSIGLAANGFGDINAFSAINNNTSPVVATITVTPQFTNGSVTCSGTSTSFTITVNPAPNVQFSSASQTICSGSSSVAVNITSSTPNVTISWTATIPSGITGATPNGATATIPAQTLTNTTNNPLTVTYTATASTSGSATCSGATASYDIVVNPIPAATATPSSQTICSGIITAIALTSPVTGTVFSWTISNNTNITGASNGNGSSIAQTLVNSSSVAQTITYTITPSFSHNNVSCTGNTITVVITVNPRPLVNNNPLNQTICSGATSLPVTLQSTVTGATFIWTASATTGTGTFITSGSNTIPAETISNTTNTDGIVTYVITPSANGCNGPTSNYTITVHPVASVTNNPLSQTVCSGAATTSVTLTSNLTGATFNWVATANPSTGITGFTANGTGNIPVQTITNTNSAPGTVTYVITPTANGCTGVPSNYIITVNPSPQITITPSLNQTICSNQQTTLVSFSSTTTGANITWSSAPVAGISGQLLSGTTSIPVHTLVNTTAAPLTVTFIITAATPGSVNCSGANYTYTITVNPSPQLQFSIPNQTICSGVQTAAVNITSSTPNVTISWTATIPSGITGATPSGATATIPAQTLTNTTNNPLTVTYTATANTSGSATCSGAGYNYSITVNPSPDVVANPQTICSNTATNIPISSSVAGTTFSWTVLNTSPITGATNGSGNTIAQVLVNNTTIPQQLTYVVTANISNNGSACNGTSKDVIVTVNPLSAINNNPLSQAVCTGLPSTPVLFTSFTANASYNWQVTSANGVTGYIASGTGNLPAMLLNNNSLAQASVVYAVTSTSNLCAAPATNYTILVNPNAKALFTANDFIKCPSFFINASNITLHQYPTNTSSYEWYANGNFIGAGTSFPGYTIVNEDDSVKITLKAISLYGCKNDSISKMFYTYKLPHPSFTKSNGSGCGPLTVSFINTTNNISLFTYLWNFGNGQTSNLAQPNAVTFVSAPSFNDTFYVVKLKVFSICDTLTFADTVFIKSKPKALFSPNNVNGCSPMRVTFTNTSSGIGNSYFWNFDDGQTLTTTSTAAFEHIFITGVIDTFHVKLIATNICGSDSIVYLIIAAPNSIHLNFSFNGTSQYGCAPHPIAFYNNSIGGGSFVWNFGDGNSVTTVANVDTVLHTYNLPGIYTVTVTAFNNCSDTSAFNTITVYPKPVPLFTANNYNPCIGQQIIFNNTSTGSSSQQWQFGDGTFSSVVNPVHTYTTPGLYNVKLIVFNSNPSGNVCRDSITISIQVTASQPGNISVSSNSAPCAPHTVTFTNLTLPAVSTTWTFGDGATATGNSVAHTYSAGGIYNVHVISTSPGGCQYITDQIITIGGPAGSLQYSSGYVCSPSAAFFQASATATNNYLWNFGDGTSQTTTLSSIYHQYLNPGIYFPSVTLQNTTGCNLLIPGLDTVKVDKITGGFTTTQARNCGNTNVNFTDTSHAYFGKSLVKWNFGDAQTGTGFSTTHAYNTTGTYMVEMIVIGNSGCTDTTRKPLYVFVNSRPTSIINGPSVKCGLENVLFNANINSTDAVTIISWLLSNGATGAGSSFTYNFTIAGTYTLRLIAGTTFGCFDTTFHTILVKPVPVVIASGDVTLCLGNSANLSVTGANTYQWTPLQYLSCTTCNNPVASPPVTTPYLVAGTINGCTAYDTVIVTVIQPLNIVVSPNDSICIGQSALLQVSGAATYLWNPSATLSSATVSNPVASPLATTIYRVIGYDGHNCYTDTAFVTIAVGLYPIVSLGANVTLAAGTQHPLITTIQNGPIASWLWNPTANLSCATCPLPIANIKKDISYAVTVTSFYGCSASDSIDIKVFCAETQVFIPNAFSPDGDGINDVLMIRGKGIVTVKHFRIFNRWGELVFERNNFAPNNTIDGWDGKVKGKAAMPDVFVYTAEVICENGSSFFYKGNISLIK